MTRARMLTLGIAACAGQASAQSRPAGTGRGWAEIGLEANLQTQHCESCVRTGKAFGPAFAWAIGVTLPAQFGIAIAGRNFQEFSWEHSQGSRYLLLIGQYAPSSLQNLTVNFGAGQARNSGEIGYSSGYDFKGGVIAGGAALRLPARSRFAFTVNANILKSVGGSTKFRPLTVTLGMGLNVSTGCLNQKC